MAKGDIRKALGILLVGSVIVSACTDKSAETTASPLPSQEIKPVKTAFPIQEIEPVKSSSPNLEIKSVTGKMIGEIGIKDLVLGMDKSQYSGEVYDDGSAGSILNGKYSVAGTTGTFGSVQLTFDKNGKLGGYLFFFYPHEFDQIKAGLASKYQLKCKTSVVSNALRQQFDQEVCIVTNEKNDNLILTKRLDRDTGTLEMNSGALLKQRQSEKQAKLNGAKKDI